MISVQFFAAICNASPERKCRIESCVAAIYDVAREVLIEMTGQGSTANVLAAICSFFIPGLGQLVQGRLLMAGVQFVLAFVLWFIFMGWIIHIWSILDAAMWKPKNGDVVRFGN